MIENKRKFYTGLGLMAAFVVVLIIFFSPVFRGQNGLDYLDNLYNSISKGSAYYIPKLRDEIQPFKGDQVAVNLKMANDEQAEQTSRLLKAGGAEVVQEASQLNVSGDLGMILDNCLVDADAMYENNGSKVSGKYGYEERVALYNWWKASKEMEKSLQKQKRFKEAEVVSLILKKAVETSYNYYKIEPQNISDKVWIVLLSLVFYVVYTMWYGFAFMFMFEGWGMKLEH
ncbi:MAG: hypothetical protein HY788_08800 [Deltaproteobacteria bacterium]|nr:hypothetical protein [Deltaproteobacteria bacterium]